MTALIEGVKVDRLYDTGAMSSCLTPETYEKHFQHKTLSNRQNISTSAAGNVNLGVLGTSVFVISVRCVVLNHQFLVCKAANDDIMSIDLANHLELS